MGALEEFADDVDAVIRDLEAQAGHLNDRKLALKTRGGEIMQRWHDHFSSKESSLKRAEAAINRLSNVPLSGGDSTFREPGAGDGADHE